MSSKQKIIAGVAGVCALFFGFVAVRIGAQPNDASMKLVQISKENNAQIGKEAYKDAYPLQYNSFMKNNIESPSPTGYGGSMEGNSHLEHQPEMVENFKGYKFAIQYDDDRGHTYAGYDLLHTKRLPGQKGSCIVCKGSYMYMTSASRRTAGRLPPSRSWKLRRISRTISGSDARPATIPTRWSCASISRDSSSPWHGAAST